MNFRIENYPAKTVDQIDHKIRITYKLYSLKNNGELLSCLGSDESLDRLLSKNEQWMHKDRKYVIRKAVIETKEEPVFKVIRNKQRIKK